MRGQAGRPPTGGEPLHVAPMLATPAAELPHGTGWAYEFKWDGYRAIVHLEGGSARIESRRVNDITHQFPQIASIADDLPGRPSLVLDGEIVALDPENRPSFGLLQQHLRSPGSGPRPTAPVPLVYFVFDLLYEAGRPLLRLPYSERRQRLSSLGLKAQALRVPPFEVDHGAAMLTVSDNLQMEGVVAKRLDSVYQPGIRSSDWLKIKHRRRQEFVIGGWTLGEGARHATFGSLLLGYYDQTRQEAAAHGTRPQLVYAGRVGTGFDDETLMELRRRLDRLTRKTNPFDVGEPGADARFVEPQLVADVSFSEWTHLGQLRQTSFRGLRDDKEPIDVLRDGYTKPRKED